MKNFNFFHLMGFLVLITIVYDAWSSYQLTKRYEACITKTNDVSLCNNLKK